MSACIIQWTSINEARSLNESTGSTSSPLPPTHARLRVRFLRLVPLTILFAETGCVSLIKAMAMGAIPITSRFPNSTLPELTQEWDLGPQQALSTHVEVNVVASTAITCLYSQILFLLDSPPGILNGIIPGLLIAKTLPAPEGCCLLHRTLPQAPFPFTGGRTLLNDLDATDGTEDRPRMTYLDNICKPIRI